MLLQATNNAVRSGDRTPTDSVIVTVVNATNKRLRFCEPVQCLCHECKHLQMKDPRDRLIELKEHPSTEHQNRKQLFQPENFIPYNNNLLNHMQIGEPGQLVLD